MWGRLLPARASLQMGSLPIALAPGAVFKHPVEAGDSLCCQDVALDESASAVQIRRRVESELTGFVAATPTDLAEESSDKNVDPGTSRLIRRETLIGRYRALWFERIPSGYRVDAGGGAHKEPASSVAFLRDTYARPVAG